MCAPLPFPFQVRVLDVHLNAFKLYIHRTYSHITYVYIVLFIVLHSSICVLILLLCLCRFACWTST